MSWPEKVFPQKNSTASYVFGCVSARSDWLKLPDSSSELHRRGVKCDVLTADEQCRCMCAELATALKWTGGNFGSREFKSRFWSDRFPAEEVLRLFVWAVCKRV